MHIQTRAWRKLSKERRDEMLLSLGISPASLRSIRALEPKRRLIAATQVALSIDPDPNSDLIDFVAGYNHDSGLCHYYRTKKELLGATPRVPKTSVKPILTSPGQVDLAELIPTEFRGYPIFVESIPNNEIHVWQKVPGGIRKITINRRIPKLLFLSGVLLYTTEGSKYAPGSGHVQLSNATPGTHRLFLEFLEALGVARLRIKARVQLHDIADKARAQEYWAAELGLSSAQFHKPLMAPQRGTPRRVTFTLHLKYNNAMLSALLTAWGADPQRLYVELSK